MSSGIQLVPLRCPSCSAGIKGENNSVFLYCGECGSGFEVSSDYQLLQVPVYFARKSASANRFLPFWAFDAKLDLRERKARTSFFSSPKGLASMFSERGTIRFYVPAFGEDVERKTPRALELTKEQPQLEYVHKQPSIAGFLFSQSDARKIADHLFLTSEIDQKDTVRDIDYKLHLSNPMVVVIAMEG